MIKTLKTKFFVLKWVSYNRSLCTYPLSTTRWSDLEKKRKSYFANLEMYWYAYSPNNPSPSCYRTSKYTSKQAVEKCKSDLMQNRQPLQDNLLLKVLFLKLCMVPHMFPLFTPQKLQKTLAFYKFHVRVTLISVWRIWMKQDTDMIDDYKHWKDDSKHWHKTVGLHNPFFNSAVSFLCLTVPNRTLWWQVLKGDIWTAAPTLIDTLTRKTTSPSAINSNQFHIRLAFTSSDCFLLRLDLNWSV